MRFTAPAKINLFLHVTGRRADGYHLLDSLTVFAKDVADSLDFEPAPSFSLTVGGPLADHRDDGLMKDNLVMRAARLMARETANETAFSIALEKNIPFGAGLGGGSADAAATVRSLERLWGAALPDDRRGALLQSLGADVPVCYENAPCRFSGTGEILSAVPALPPLFLVLVWPGIAISTPDVFRAREGAFGAPAAAMTDFTDLDSLVAYLGQTRNDLQAAAEKLCPAIAAARQFLEAQDGCLLARMSGSGSCVFGLFRGEASARAVKVPAPWWQAYTRA